MKTDKIITVLLVALIAAIIIVGVYAAVTIWSDPVVVTPQTPTITVEPSNLTPDYDSLITLTATLSVPSDGIIVTFYADGVSIGTDTTALGEATLDYTVGIDPITFKASAEIT
jgi:hypothetical protein